MESGKLQIANETGVGCVAGAIQETMDDAVIQREQAQETQSSGEASSAAHTKSNSSQGAEINSTRGQAASEIPSGSSHVVLVVFQHGSHGYITDFDNIKLCLQRAWQERQNVELILWATPVNEGIRTDDGLEICGKRLANALAGQIAETSSLYPSATVHLVCISHSFGGPIMRRALFDLSGGEALTTLNLAVFVTLASPHVGATQMRPSLRMGGRILGKIFSNAYEDLLLDSEVMDSLCTEAALAPLALFQHRILYTCGRNKDHLIGFETGSLVVPLCGDLPPCMDECPHVHHELILLPFDEAVWKKTLETKEKPGVRVSLACTKRSSSAHLDGRISRIINYISPDGTEAPSQFEEAVTLEQCVKAFDGFDDYSGRARRAASMLCALRSVGNWSLHVVDFPERLVLAHSAIIHHPSNVKNPRGLGEDIAMHLASKVCSVTAGIMRRWK